MGLAAVTLTLTRDEAHFLYTLVSLRISEVEAAEKGQPRTADANRTMEFRRGVADKLGNAL